MKKWTILILLIMISALYSQDQITLTAQAVQGTYFNVFYPTYFDPSNPAGQPDLFRLILQNTTENEYPYKIIFGMKWRGEGIINNAEAYPIIPNDVILSNQMITIESKNLISEEQNQDMFYVDISWQDILDSNPEFNDLIVNTGMFPDGLYELSFQVWHREESTELSNMAYLSFMIRSGNAIQLISPGSPIGLGASKVMDTNPYFVWFSNFHNYTFRLWELDSEPYSSEQVEAMEPLWEEKDLQSTSYSFPLEITLEYEKTYAWQILAEIETPTQINSTYQKSNVYTFQIVNEQTGLNNNQLLIELLRQFSSLNVEGLEEFIALLESGYEMSDAKYHALLDQFSDGNKIKSVQIK